MGQRARGAAAGARPAAAGRARVESRPVRGARHDLAALRGRLTAIVAPLVTRAGLDLEDLSVRRAGRRHLVRVTVDGETGVGHDELSELSHVISAELDRAERADGELSSDAYTLEVSSPGVDRPLTLPRHWRRNVGRLVTVRVGDATLTARVGAVDSHGVRLDSDAGRRTVAFADLGPGRVQVEFDRSAPTDRSATHQEDSA